MANLIIVCGPQAVGKMAVAECLRDKLKYNLMINHDSIEVSDRIFGFNTPAQREFNFLFRQKAFEIAAKHHVDLIFTCVCAFDSPTEKQALSELAAMFEQSGGKFYFVELCADLSVRLERNRSPYRLHKKPSKKDLAWSEKNLIEDAHNHRLNLDADEYWFDNHVKIDNTHLSPEEAADQIVQTFGLTPNQKEEHEYRYGVSM